MYISSGLSYSAHEGAQTCTTKKLYLASVCRSRRGTERALSERLFFLLIATQESAVAPLVPPREADNVSDVAYP